MANSRDGQIPLRRPGASRKQSSPNARLALLALLSAPLVSAQSDCISLSGSTTCPAFESASISTTGYVAGLFPFLQFVSSRESFDNQLRSYVRTAYVQNKYENTFGCGGIDLTDTDELYARFTTSVICNAIVQNSIDACSLSDEDSRPLCADTCAHYAQSEALLTADDGLCSNPGDNLISLIRADFTNCALPPDSLTSTGCIQGIANEPENCGYGNSTVGLCSYCASGGINSTDTCCYNSDVTERCDDVTLPSGVPTMTFDVTTVLPSSTSTGSPDSSNDGDEDDDDGGLSGGAIAGIVVGSIAGLALLAGLIILCLCCLRRRRRRDDSQNGSVFNQPAPSRKGPIAMEQADVPKGNTGYEVLPGGRIARMSALEDHSSGSNGHGAAMGAAALGAGAGYMAGRSRDQSSSDFGSSPESDSRAGMGVLRPPPTNIRRNGSLSSNSVLAGEDPNSPTSGGMSSPQGIASQQSEQLPFFKDYYSSDDIHPGDRVSVLWAYQPRAPDEFSLERGDMLKVVGIWDDGWATGIMVDERADEWETRRAQRDSGVSSTSGGPRPDSSPPVSGEIKAFPLVCVCLPEHWRKTIEGDGSTESGSGNTPGP